MWPLPAFSDAVKPGSSGRSARTLPEVAEMLSASKRSKATSAFPLVVDSAARFTLPTSALMLPEAEEACSSSTRSALSSILPEALAAERRSAAAASSPISPEVVSAVISTAFPPKCRSRSPELALTAAFRASAAASISPEITCSFRVSVCSAGMRKSAEVAVMLTSSKTMSSGRVMVSCLFRAKSVWKPGLA